MLIPDNIVEKCDKIVSATSGNKLHDELVLSECVFMTSEILKNDKISIPDLKRLIAPKLEKESNDMRKIVSAAIDQCVNLGYKNYNETVHKIKSSPYNIRDVDPLYAFVTQCIITSVIADCPRSAEMDLECEFCVMDLL